MSWCRWGLEYIQDNPFNESFIVNFNFFRSTYGDDPVWKHYRRNYRVSIYSIQIIKYKISKKRSILTNYKGNQIIILATLKLMFFTWSRKNSLFFSRVWAKGCPKPGQSVSVMEGLRPLPLVPFAATSIWF